MNSIASTVSIRNKKRNQKSHIKPMWEDLLCSQVPQLKEISGEIYTFGEIILKM